jgi:hypothetical protein
MSYTTSKQAIMNNIISTSPKHIPTNEVLSNELKERPEFYSTNVYYPRNMKDIIRDIKKKTSPKLTFKCQLKLIKEIDYNLWREYFCVNNKTPFIKIHTYNYEKIKSTRSELHEEFRTYWYHPDRIEAYGRTHFESFFDSIHFWSQTFACDI